MENFIKLTCIYSHVYRTLRHSQAIQAIVELTNMNIVLIQQVHIYGFLIN